MHRQTRRLRPQPPPRKPSLSPAQVLSKYGPMKESSQTRFGHSTPTKTRFMEGHGSVSARGNLQSHVRVTEPLRAERSLPHPAMTAEQSSGRLSDRLERLKETGGSASARHSAIALSPASSPLVAPRIERSPTIPPKPPLEPRAIFAPSVNHTIVVGRHGIVVNQHSALVVPGGNIVRT